MGVILNWSSDFPTSIDDRSTNFPSVSDGVHDVLASHVNALADAMVAVENDLFGGVVRRDGSFEMTGNLNLGGNNLINTLIPEVQLPEQGGDPTPVADNGFVYTKDVGGVTELFYEDDSGLVTQLTGGGSLSHSLQQAYDDGNTITLVDGTPVALTHDSPTSDTISLTDSVASRTLGLRPDELRMPKGAVAALYNTTDEVTNFERVRMGWGLLTADRFAISTSSGGTGTDQLIEFGVGDVSPFIVGSDFVQITGSNPIRFGGTNEHIRRAAAGSGEGITFKSTNDVANLRGLLDAEGDTGLSLTPEVNIAAGTPGAYTAMLVNVTETSLGDDTGAQLLTDWQVGGVRQAQLDNTGRGYFGQGLSDDVSIVRVGTAGHGIGDSSGNMRVRSGTSVLQLQTTNGVALTVAGTGPQFRISGGGTDVSPGLTGGGDNDTGLVWDGSDVLGLTAGTTRAVQLSADPTTPADGDTNIAVRTHQGATPTAALQDVTLGAMTVDGQRPLTVLNTGSAQSFSADSAGNVSVSTLTVNASGGIDMAGNPIRNIGGVSDFNAGATLYFYNTTDESTDFERVRFGWGITAADEFGIITDAGGTGIARSVVVDTADLFRVRSGGADRLLVSNGLAQVYGNTASLRLGDTSAERIARTGGDDSISIHTGGAEMLTVRQLLDASGDVGLLALATVDHTGIATAYYDGARVDVDASGTIGDGTDDPDGIGNTLHRWRVDTGTGLATVAAVTPSGGYVASDGTISDPAYRVSSEVSGWRLANAGRLGFVAAGTEIMQMTSGSFRILGSGTARVVFGAFGAEIGRGGGDVLRVTSGGVESTRFQADPGTPTDGDVNLAVRTHQGAGPTAALDNASLGDIEINGTRLLGVPDRSAGLDVSIDTLIDTDLDVAAQWTHVLNTVDTWNGHLIDFDATSGNTGTIGDLWAIRIDTGAGFTNFAAVGGDGQFVSYFDEGGPTGAAFEINGIGGFYADSGQSYVGITAGGDATARFLNNSSLVSGETALELFRWDSGVGSTERVLWIEQQNLAATDRVLVLAA